MRSLVTMPHGAALDNLGDLDSNDPRKGGVGFAVQSSLTEEQAAAHSIVAAPKQK
jgi:hypothetical protein